MMVFKWLRQTRKAVLFRPSELDQALLAAVKAELVKQPGLSFSSLCKEALHQHLLGDRPSFNHPPWPANQRLESLEAQVLSIEQRFFAQEKHRLERLEAQLDQLSRQVAHMGGAMATPASTSTPPASQPKLYEEGPYLDEVEDVPEDPVLSRLSGLIDDF
jgi:hypothetical protein